jgi:hypothetical protein
MESEALRDTRRIQYICAVETAFSDSRGRFDEERAGQQVRRAQDAMSWLMHDEAKSALASIRNDPRLDTMSVEAFARPLHSTFSA